MWISPFIDRRDNAHAAALPIAPAPTRTTSPSEPSRPLFSELPPLRAENVTSASSFRCLRNTYRKTFAAARQAAAPGPNGLSVLPTVRELDVLIVAVQPFEPTKIACLTPFVGDALPMTISTVGLSLKSMFGFSR